MRMRGVLFGICGLGLFELAACGTLPADADEQGNAVLSSALPVTLRLTTIKMNGHSTNPPLSVNVSVTLPGLATTTRYIGDYSGRTATNTNTQFNCSTVGAVPGSDGYCTTKLPLRTTVGSTQFTGTFPSNTSSKTASVRINGTTTNFTIDSLGRSSQTCATTWMYINNLIDGDKITICWQTGLIVPVTAPPMIETVLYPAPGELSQVGLQQMNQISTKTDLSYQESGNASIGVSATFINSKSGDQSAGFNLTFQGTQGQGYATTITTGSATGYMLPSKSIVPNPDDTLYLMLVGAKGTFINWHDGTPPTMTTDLSTGTILWCTLGSLKGLAQTPQVFSDEILAGNMQQFQTYITSAVAQQFIAQDPSASGQSIEAAVLAKPKRFVPVTPAHMTLTRSFITTEQQINAKQTDQYVSQSTGVSQTLSFILGFGIGTMDTLTTTYSNLNQSTATVQLQTNNPSIEGTVDLYMDTAFGTIVPVPHLEDSNNAPTNACTGLPATNHVLLPGQSLSRGQSLTSCHGDWTLTLRQDGTLAEYFRDGTLVQSFYPSGATTAVMQTNGDFVLKDANGTILSESGTSSSKGAYFILQDDGFLAVYNPAPTPEGGTGGALPALWTLAPGG